MSWSNSSVIELINAYKSKEILWNPGNRNYYNRLLKKESWDELAIELQRPSTDLKKKMDYLLSALRREKQKIVQSKTTAQGPDDVYQSNWFAFPHLEFLFERNRHRKEILRTDNLDVNDIVIASDDESFENDESLRGHPSGIQHSESQTSDRRTSNSQQPTTQRSTKHRTGSHLSRRVSALTKFKSPAPIKKNKSASQNDPIVSEALQMMKSSPQAATSTTSFTASPSTPDPYQIYANYLASKFRTYTHRTYLTVEHRINNILYCADNGQYEGESRHQNSYMPGTISSNEIVPISDHKEENIDYETNLRDSDGSSDLITFQH